ncbi:MAG: MFS transporter [Verrucomicrobiales bacterium]|nr:MFS transporter [Verrucomicrobiales bacterium]
MKGDGQCNETAQPGPEEGPGSGTLPDEAGTRRLLMGAMLLQFAANGSVLPFVTMLLRDRGLVYEQVGWIYLAASTVMLVAPFGWGFLADRHLPLNRVLAILNTAGAVALLVLVRQREFTGLLVAYVAFSACLNPVFTLTNALAFHHLPRPREQFPGLRAWGSVGWIVPFLPISLWTAFRPEAGLDFCVWMGAGMCLAMAIYSFRLPHTEPGSRRPAGGAGPRVYGPALRRLLRDWDYLAVLTSMFLMSGAFMMVLYYGPPFLERLGVSRPWIGPVQAVGVVFEVVLFRWQSVLLRRFRLTSVILVGGLSLAVRHFLFAVSSNVWLLTATYLLVALVVVFHHTGIALLANALAGREVRSTAQTLLAFCGFGLGPMFGNGVATWLTRHYGDDLRPVFLAGGIMACMAMGVIAARRRHLEVAGRRLDPPV